MKRKLILFLFSLLLNAVLQAQSFQGLGDLAGGSFRSEAHGISGDGTVVVGASGSGNGLEAFRWSSAGGMQGLGELPGSFFNSQAFAVSNDGNIVVGWDYSPSDREAFHWTSGAGMVGLGDLPGGSFWSRAIGISANGTIIVGSGFSASGNEAFRWTSADGMVGLGDLPGGDFGSTANGISADGSVIVGSSFSASGSEAFRWTSADGMVGLGDLPGGSFFSEALAISGDGSTVVGSSSSDFEVINEDPLIQQGISQAFRWTSAGGMQPLGSGPQGEEFYSEALDLSFDGSVVVGQENGQAFIWDESNGLRLLQEVLETDYGLDLSGWQLREATGISDDGSIIVGIGKNPNSDTEAWMATLP